MTDTLYGANGISGGGAGPGTDSVLDTVVDAGGGNFTMTTVASIGRIIVGGGNAMAFHPSTHVLYAVTSFEDGTPDDFLSIDKTTAAPTLIAALSISGNTGSDEIFDIDFRSDGVLFAALYRDTAFETWLATIDIATGVVTPVGLMNAGFRPMSLCFDANDVCWVAPQITSKKLCTVNQSTGALTVVFASLTNNTSGDGIMDGASFKHGTTDKFYAIQEHSVGQSTLVTVDVGAGTIDNVASFTRGSHTSLGCMAWLHEAPAGPRIALRFRAA